MMHDHSHAHIHLHTDREDAIVKVTLVGSVVNAILVIFKLLAGFFAHSSAMVADGIHSLSDFLTDLVVIAMVRVSGKPQDKSHNYGHGKYETLATLIIGFLLLIVGGVILYEAVEKIIFVTQGGTITPPGWWAFIAAVVSIVCKEGLYWFTILKGKHLNSKALEANAWHHRSDAFSSIGTALGIVGAILLGKRWVILDPIAAGVLSFFIFHIGFKLVKGSLSEFLEKSLPEEVEEEIKTITLSVEGVEDVHNLRTRQIGAYYAIDMHIRMDGNLSLTVAHDKTKEVETLLHARFGKETFLNIHAEPIK